MTTSATHLPATLKPWQAARRRIRAWDQKLDDLADEARSMAGEVLGAAGYHRHDRGGWRLRRRKGSGMSGDLKLTRMDRAETAELFAASAIRASRSPDAANAYFDRWTATDPGFAPLLIKAHHGNLSFEAESAMLDRLGKGDHLKREAIRRHVGQLRRDLLGADEPTAIERVIVDRAVVWLPGRPTGRGGTCRLG